MSSQVVGITEYHANLTPEKKLAFIRELITHHEGVAMIGDGVNDVAAFNFLTDFLPIINIFRLPGASSRVPFGK